MRQHNNLIKNFVNNKDMADVVFLVGKEQTRFYGHKLILSITSLMFKGMFFTCQWKEISHNKEDEITKIRIPDVDPKVFLAVLSYCYQQKPKITLDMVFDLYKIADKYLIEKLKKVCCLYLKKKINCRNCIGFFDKALTLGDDILSNKFLKCIERNSKQILKRKGIFNQCSPKCIKQILKSDNLLIKEIELFRRIEECPQETKQKWQLLKQIRFNLIGTSSIKDIESHDLLKNYKRYLKKKNKKELDNFCLSLGKKKDHKKNSKKDQQFTDLKRDLPRKIKFKKKNSEMKILVLASTENEKYISDVKNSIADQGITHIEAISVNQRLPDWKEMKNYDCAFVFSYYPFSNAVALGNLLARFVETGKGIVICACDSLRENHARALGGRIMTDDFLPIKPGSLVYKQKLELGIILKPHHPIMDKVKRFGGGRDSFHINTKTVNHGGKVLASWENGVPLIAVKTNDQINHTHGMVVVLNIWPVSDQVRKNGSFWRTNTDGKTLISNSVQFAVNY
ncbi:btb (poz) domain-containing 2a-related [Anaeramoeba flamelloides]|uniref:Btb (Poz) domain-containing 2a-related n=1 Tax=Anaeramoeba flamelloides TaxID=1746091 RepID=A0ABQ8Y434_9EUKA|nr:btb (poz) domain-containing 2a-related [Anaeramoeba flamelloides]